MDRSLKWAVAIVITLILVLSPVFSQGCGATKWNPKGGNGQDTMLTLTRTDNGKSITMQVNDLLLLSLDENPTTGFQWAVDGVGSDLVELQSSEYVGFAEKVIEKYRSLNQ